MGLLRTCLLASSVTIVCWGCGESDSKKGDGGSGGSSSITTTITSTGSGTTSSTTGSSSSTTASGGTGATGNGGTSSVGGSTTTGEAGASDSGGSAGAAGDTGAGGGTSGVEIIDDCNYTACGGELDNGTWQYNRVCVEKGDLLGLFSAACDSVELVSSSGEVSGSINFDDPDFTQDLTLSVTAEFNLPASCNLNCTLVGALLVAAGISDAGCTANGGGGCTCSGTLEGSTTTEGQYSTDNETLTLDGTDETYCAGDGSLQHTGSIQGVSVVFHAVPD